MHRTRVPLFNRRPGRDAGDKVMRFFAAHASRIFAPSIANRWTGAH
jgi:hypothetical protein